MPEVRAEAEIHCSAERIFEVITDLRGRSLTLLTPLFVAAFRSESRRTLLALKAYVDTLEAGLRRP